MKPKVKNKDENVALKVEELSVNKEEENKE